jgi:DMSO/TMAO reductase YedYZ molybdopterin-dependent catalytic subunit
VPLVEILDRATPTQDAVEILFRGADRGPVEGSSEPIAFERSLGVDDARQGDALLAYAMNGDPLPIDHGYPLRLIVPGWYAVASVKWLTEIEVIGAPFVGFFQTQRYVFESEHDGAPVREPVRYQRIKSLITEPTGANDVPVGDIAIRGVAWGGAVPIERVEVSIGDGPWCSARLIGERQRHCWRWWELLTHLDSPGDTTVQARAIDRVGRVQPERPEWNRLGYGGNGIHTVALRVR